nr:hypothetical protein [Methanothrix sp.]
GSTPRTLMLRLTCFRRVIFLNSIFQLWRLDQFDRIGGIDQIYGVDRIDGTDRIDGIDRTTGSFISAERSVESLI